MTPSLADMLGIKFPILSAPMGMIAGGGLAAAVTRAGGLGMIGVGYEDAAWIERQWSAAAGTPVGVGFITWDLARAPHRLDAALRCRPVAVMLSFGDPRPFVERIRQAGARVILQVQTLAQAVEAARLSPDVIVAQGTEAGGHGGARGLLPLLPAVVDRVAPIPVLAAGGIADGRGIAACLASGAAGVLVGSRFYLTDESLAHPEAKARIVASSGDDTVRTRVFDIVRQLPWPPHITGRVLRNRFTAQWHGREAELELVTGREKEFYQQAVAAGDFETAAVWTGEGIDLMEAVLPAETVMKQLVEETERSLARLRALSWRSQ